MCGIQQNKSVRSMNVQITDSFFSNGNKYSILIVLMFTLSSCDIVNWINPTKDTIEHYVPVKINNRYGFIDASGKVVIEAKYQDALAFQEGLAVVRENWRWKYIDTSGEDAIDGEGAFQEIRSFKDGIAAVRMQNRWGYIDKSGEWWINPRFRSAYDFEQNIAYVRTLNYRNWVYINLQGIELEAFDGFNQLDFHEKASFSGSRALVLNDDKYGFIDQNLELVVDLIYNDAHIFSDGLAAVLVSNRWGFINEEGEMAINPTFIETGNFSEGLCAVRLNSNFFGYIDKSGNLKISEQFEQALDFKEGLAAVKSDGLWGFINKEGQMVINPQFEKVDSFDQDLAKFYQSRFLEDGEVEDIFGYLNKEGEIIWAPSF